MTRATGDWSMGAFHFLGTEGAQQEDARRLFALCPSEVLATIVPAGRQRRGRTSATEHATLPVDFPAATNSGQSVLVLARWGVHETNLRRKDSCGSGACLLGNIPTNSYDTCNGAHDFQASNPRAGHRSQQYTPGLSPRGNLAPTETETPTHATNLTRGTSEHPTFKRLWTVCLRVPRVKANGIRLPPECPPYQPRYS